MNHILHRLEEDTPVICKLITQLLLNTFHPIQREDQVCIGILCVDFIFDLCYVDAYCFFCVPPLQSFKEC